MVKKITPSKISFANINLTELSTIDTLHLKSWISETINSEKFQLLHLSIIFLSDDDLLKINKEFLKHDYYTDVITFDYSKALFLKGEIYVSLDSVKKNAEIYNQEFSTELYRVIIHGVLHLCKYNDHTNEERVKMREKEDHYLELLSLLNS